MKLNRGVTFLVVAAVGAGVVAGASTMSPDVQAAITGTKPDLLTAMRARSPGERAPGAETSKQKLAMAAPVAAVLPAASAAPVAAAAPVAVAPAVVAPIAAAPAPVAAVIPPAAAAAVPAVAVAAPAVLGAAGPGLGAAGLLIPVAAVAAVGGGGGGGGGVTISPQPAPAIPEPATWLMMITGIGFLGAALRRRRDRASAGAFGRALAPAA
jgi:2-oxoglutarate dehydrogenase E2 component (dihydrolipoamide succinyltransferase)